MAGAGGVFSEPAVRSFSGTLAAMTQTIEIRERRSGAVRASMPLYEFLAALHTGSAASDDLTFDELEILIDGQELLPEPAGHA
jgi:hypothetical protein